MGTNRSQIDVQHTPTGFRKIRKAIKKMTTRLRRRLEKKLKEDTPPRQTGGWVS
jgi:hypothetical protein